jgi:type II secretory pathway pseudopilin PulG
VAAPYPAPVGPPQTSSKAIASLILGIFFFMIPTAILAIIFGHLSLSDIKKSAGRLRGRGLAITGLVLGYAGIAFIPIILIIAALAIPSLLNAKIAANETMAVSTVRAISNAETQYQITYPDRGFTCRLEDLGGASDSCSPAPERACLLRDDAVTGRRFGYLFELGNCAPAQGGGPIVSYQLSAHPEKKNTTGRHAFCTDQDGTIRSSDSGSAEECLMSGRPIQPSH